MPLTEKRERFCREYVVDSNGTQAAIRAGYAEGSAAEEAYRLLRNAQVRERIEALREGIDRSTTASAIEIRERLTQALRFQMNDYFGEDGKEDPEAMKDPVRLGRLERIRTTTRYTKDGDRIVTHEIWGPDIVRIAAELNKMDGNYDQPEGTSVNVTVLNIPPLKGAG